MIKGAAEAIHLPIRMFDKNNNDDNNNNNINNNNSNNNNNYNDLDHDKTIDI